MFTTKKESTKDTYIRLRVTKEEKQEIEKAAKISNISVSDFLRKAIKEEFKKKELEV